MKVYYYLYMAYQLVSGVHADDSSGTSHYSYDSKSLRSIPSSDEEDNGKKRLESPQYNSDNGFGQVHFQLGMEFDTIAIFKDAVKDYTINLGREVKWIKNDLTRCKARCKVKDYPWEIYCARSKAARSFQVKTFIKEHSCWKCFQELTS